MNDVARNLLLPAQADERGLLVWAQFPTHLPFTPVRVFFIRDVPKGEIRGNHAHVKCEQVIIAVSGAFLMECFSSSQGHSITQLMFPPTVDLLLAYTAFYVPAGYLVTLSKFTDDAVCVVLASHKYDLEDIYDNRPVQ